MRIDPARLPIILCLLLHGFAANRLLLSISGMILVLWWPKKLVLSEGRGWAVAILGGLVGMAVGLLTPMPAGPFPQVPFSGVASAVMALTVYLTLCEAWIYAWIAGFVVVILGGHAPVSSSLVAAQAFTAFSSVICFVILSRIKVSWRGALFLWLIAGGTLGLGAAVSAAQGVVAGMVVGLMQGELFASSLGSMGMLGIPPVSTVSPSDRVVLELSGDLPGRLRSGVLDRFDGETWSASEEIQEEATGEKTTPTGTITLYFRQGFKSFLPSPHSPRVLDKNPAHFSAGDLLIGNASWGEQHEIRTGSSAINRPPLPEDQFLPDALRAALLPYAEAQTATLQDTRSKASAMEVYLSTQFRYSLSTNLRGDAPPLVILLRERRPAYCIYFASAMAALLRTEGIATRLVSGYLVEPANPYSGRAFVRERDAHAWVEVWIPEEAVWAAFDPTPGRDADPEPSLLGALQEAIHAWFEWQVLQFSTHPAESLQRFFFSWPVLGTLGLAVAYAVAERIRTAQTGALPVRAPAGVPPELWPPYRRYQKLLRRAGLRPSSSDRDEQLLVQLEEKKGRGAKDAAAAFLEAYQRGRFGGRMEPDVEEKLRRLEETLRKPPINGR